MSTIVSAGARFGQALSEEKPLQITSATECVEAGAGGIFAEAAHDRPNHETFDSAIRVPLQANTSEFGQLPLLSAEELGSVGVGMVLYPLSAFRAMNMAAENVYTAIGHDGHQKNVIDQMQTRDVLYDRIGYHDFEQKLDALFASENNTSY